jgi:hypothetical protein
MTIRSWLRALERDALRPLGRWLRRLGGRSRSASRIEELELRIDALEGLVRELTGLAWLRLDDQPAARPTAGTGGSGAGPAPREAA